MSKIANFPYPTPIPAKIWGVPFGVDPPYWGLRRAKRLGSSAVKLFSKNSNLYDHDTSQHYRQTDGRTDRQTTCLAIAIPCYAMLRAVIHNMRHRAVTLRSLRARILFLLHFCSAYSPLVLYSDRLIATALSWVVTGVWTADKLE